MMQSCSSQLSSLAGFSCFCFTADKTKSDDGLKDAMAVAG